MKTTSHIKRQQTLKEIQESYEGVAQALISGDISRMSPEFQAEYQAAVAVTEEDSYEQYMSAYQNCK